MPSAIVRRNMNAAVAQRGVSRQTRREVALQVEQVNARAVVHAAVVESGMYVGQVGMFGAEILTAQAEHAAAMYPAAAHRVNAIADAYAGLVVAEIRKMAFE